MSRLSRRSPFKPREQSEPVKFRNDALASFLIAFCCDSGIPLPRAGSKTITVQVDAVALHIATQTEPSAVQKPAKLRP